MRFSNGHKTHTQFSNRKCRIPITNWNCQLKKKKCFFSHSSGKLGWSQSSIAFGPFEYNNMNYFGLFMSCPFNLERIIMLNNVYSFNGLMAWNKEGPKKRKILQSEYFFHLFLIFFLERFYVSITLCWYCIEYSCLYNNQRLLRWKKIIGKRIFGHLFCVEAVEFAMSASSFSRRWRIALHSRIAKLFKVVARF